MSQTTEEPSSDLSEAPLRLAILGCSGSIGSQALDVCRQHADRLRVTALSVHRDVAALVAAARKFSVRHVAVTDPECASDPRLRDLPAGCDLLVGPEGMEELCRLATVDCVLDAVVGEAGLGAAYTALAEGKRLAIANKEALVCAGDLLMPLAQPEQIIPVDSEHSAIFQCLRGERREELSRIWLTCSGGPFRGWSREALESVTAAQALAHPTWSMGPKITVDSATLMNKGLEVLEASQLFGVSVDEVTVLVHPESKIHSMVEFCDGSTLAQLGPSDMRIPIQLAFSYPERWDTPAPRVDYRQMGPLTFEAPDLETFRCLPLALEAGRRGGTLPCAMNAANEVANAAFREGRAGFCDIDRVVEGVMDATAVEPVESLEQLAAVDAMARARAVALVRGLS